MSICMRCGGDCTCNRHGGVPEELFYICCKNLKYPVDHKGKCLELIRQVLDEHVTYKLKRRGMSGAELAKHFEKSGMRIELGAQYSVKGQIAQLVNGVRNLDT